MLVTQITEASKPRYRVYIDGQFAFILYKGELRKFRMKEGEELSTEIYQEIMTQILPKREIGRASCRERVSSAV